MATSIGTLAHLPHGLPSAMSLRSTRDLRTGTWRTLRPRYVDAASPCNLDCPAGTDVRRMLALAADGDLEGAWRTIRLRNPFPGICGRVCYHPCELACNRGHVDAPIAIHGVERAVADAARLHRFAPEPLGRAAMPRIVAVVGSGPAGLSCAYHLARLGHYVTVFEAQPRPGGMLRYGIPAYRLPRAILDHEVALLHQMGVRFVCKARWPGALAHLASFDATFLAIGLQQSKGAGVPGESLPGVRAGLTFLREINTSGGKRLSGPVVVIGGGNTALDCARSALRLGAEPVIVYRRAREDMPAHPDEIAQAEAEGIPIYFHAAPVRFLEQDGRLHAVECQRMRPGPPDASGRRRPEPIPGDEFVVRAGLALTAIGEDVERAVVADLLDARGARIASDRWGRTPLGAVFAGGDAATGAGTVVDAIASGRRAAEAMEGFFDGRDPVETAAAERVGPDHMNFFYFGPTPRVMVPHRPAADARSSFGEVVGGFSWSAAQCEARRCAGCGACTQCDTCLVFCPDVAIRHAPGGGYEIDEQHCKGCGVCAAECPRGALRLLPEGAR